MSCTKTGKSLRQIIERAMESAFCVGITLFVAVGFFKMLPPPGLMA